MSTLADALGEEDPRPEHMLSMHAVAVHWGELPPRGQQIPTMDFRGDMNQTQIGQRLHISQMHVSGSAPAPSATSGPGSSTRARAWSQARPPTAPGPPRP
jgi:hypothetical protein